MILAAVAFVLAATVLLAIGLVVDAGTAFIWASIGACLVAFAMLGIRASVRRRGRDTGAAEAGPAEEGDAQPLAPRRRVRPAGEAVPAGFVAVEPDDDEPTVTILHGDRAGGATSAASPLARGPDEVDTPPGAGFLDEVGDEATVTIFLGGRARQSAAGADEPVPVLAPDEVDAPDEAPQPDEPAVATDPGPAAPTPAAAAGPKVVRRVVRSRDESTNTVVQLVVTADGTIGRRVVRRSSSNTPRTVRRVVRRSADADAGEDRS